MADYNKYLDELFSTTKNIGKEIGPIAKQGASKAKTLGKGAIKTFVPYIDASIYAGQGINDFRTGHPFRGTGQLTLAGLDALADTAGLMAGSLTGGGGYLGERALKAAGKAAIKAGGKKALKYFAKQSAIKPALVRGVASVGLQSGINNGKQDSPEQLPQQQPNNQSKQQVNNTATNIGRGYTQYPSTSTDDFIRQLVATNGINVGDSSVPIDTTGTLENIPNQQNEQPQADNDILNRLSEYYEQQKELRKPYLEALQDYANNYQDYQRKSFNMDRYLAGIAGWSGNDNFARMIGRYNPATVEATRLDLLNKLAQEQVNELDLGNKAIGNAALLQEAGLSPDAAFADPNMIKSIATIMNARTAAEARKYVADQTYKARIYDTQLDNMIKKEINNNRMSNARYLTQLREQNRYKIAQLQAQAYGYGGNVAGALQQLPLQ